MKYNRRKFLNTTTMAIGSAAFSGMLAGCGGSRTGNGKSFRYSLCSEIVREFSWQEQCRIIGEAGFDGVEIAPFTLVKESVDEITADNRQQMVQQMKDAGIVCCGLHWLFVPPPKGLHFTTSDIAVRQRSIEYLGKLIDFCGDMEGKVMIFGSPLQRGSSPGVSVEDAKNYMAEGLLKVADHAKERNVTILVESLPRAEKTDVVNTLDEAVQMVNRINHPNISSMFDYHNTKDETEPLAKLVERNIRHIEHVHVQNINGTLITQDKIPGELVEILATLKKIGYDKWVSIEVFDFTPGGKFIAEEGMKTFRKIETML